MAQRRKDCCHCVHAGEQISDSDGGFHRLACWLAGQAHQAAHRLDHVVVAGAFGVGPGLAEAGDRAIDERGVDRLQACEIEPVFLQCARLEVLNNDLTFSGKFANQFSAFGLRKVDRYRTLVAVGGEVIGGVALRAIRMRGEGRTPGARVVSRARLFNLDDVGAQIAENLRRPRPSEHAGKIEHAHAGEAGLRDGRVCHQITCDCLALAEDAG